MKKSWWVLAGAGLVAAGAWAVEARRRHPNLLSRIYGVASSNPYHSPVERRETPDPGALAALARGVSCRTGLDLDRLKALNADDYKPLAEHLGSIRAQRGSSEVLIFVREGDLADLAALAGKPRDEFIAQFKKLGVVLSMN